MKKLGCKILGIFLICGLILGVLVCVGVKVVKPAMTQNGKLNSGSFCVIEYDYGDERKEPTGIDRLMRGVATLTKIRKSLKQAKVRDSGNDLTNQTIAPKSKYGRLNFGLVGLDKKKLDKQKVENGLKKISKQRLKKDEIKETIINLKKVFINDEFKLISKNSKILEKILKEGYDEDGSKLTSLDKEYIKLEIERSSQAKEVIKQIEKELDTLFEDDGLAKIGEISEKFNLKKFELENRSDAKLPDKLQSDLAED